MHERLKTAEEEATRDPIFLLQTSSVHVVPSSFEHELYVENEEGGVFLTPESHTKYLESDFSVDDALDEFWQNAKTLSEDELVKQGLAHRIWTTQSVWLTREEAEHHAGTQRPHHYGEQGRDWKVYCVTAEGELARLLVGGLASGTNQLYDEREATK